ncbi:MAG: HAD family hydrolase [Planctomycetes bacterium]|nr:HAD family hydrolase [Planctomycetota bacterium]
MKEYDAYLFDADGTIMDTRELIYQCFAHVGRTQAVPVPDRAFVNSKTGLPVQTHLRELVGYDRPAEFYDQAIAAYTDHMQAIYRSHLATFPGVREGLAELAARGKKLAVVTSRRRASLELFLDALDLQDFFAVLVTPEDTERHKPDPAPAVFAMRRLAADPAGTVFIGDAEFDIRCGHAAGTETVYVAWGGVAYKTWPLQPDLVVHQFRELLPDGKDTHAGD